MADAGFAATIFAERGVAEKVTLGIDGFFDHTSDALTGTVFARYTFFTEDSHVWAVSAGLGGEYRVDERLLQLVDDGPILSVDHRRAGAFVRLGAHYGRGLESGWFAADLSYAVGRAISLDDPPLPSETLARAKLDLTYGRRLREPLTAIGQLFFEDYDGDTSVSAQIGAGYEFSGFTIDTALRQCSGGDTTVKIGVSCSF
ncbi:MAG: hypothetical protein AAGF78_13650 [Pseudomonadota bacterium]